MKQIFILIHKNEIKSIDGFFDRKEMHQYQVNNLNEILQSTKLDLIWVLQPNY